MDDFWFLLAVLGKDLCVSSATVPDSLDLCLAISGFRIIVLRRLQLSFVHFLELAHAVADVVRFLVVATLDVILVLVVAALNVILLAVDVYQFLHFHILFGFAGLNFCSASSLTIKISSSVCSASRCLDERDLATLSSFLLLLVEDF